MRRGKMSRKNRKSGSRNRNKRRSKARNSKNTINFGVEKVLPKPAKVLCLTPTRCFLFVSLFWIGASLLAISLLTNAYAIPLSLSDANVIRFGTNLQEYLLGETSSLHHKGYLQRKIMIQEQSGIWFMAFSLMSFGIITAYAKFSQFCDMGITTTYKCKDFFCAKNIFLHTLIPVIWGTLLSVFGILITIFSLWSSAL